MNYLDEELDRKDIDISSKLSQLDQVSLPCEKNWETTEIYQERIPYLEVGSTGEVKGYLEEGCSSKYEFDGGGLQSYDNLYNTPICSDNIFSSRLECTSSFHGHEIEHIEDGQVDQTNVESLSNQLQHMYDGNFEENQILQHLERLTGEVIFEALHREIVVVSGSQSIISHHEPNVFLEKYSFSKHN